MFKGTMKDFFDKINTFEWGFCVFAEEGELTLKSECVCLDCNSDEVVDDEFYCKVVLDGKEYIELLTLSNIEDVLAYIKEQVPNPSDDLKLKAVLYYYETDCFLEVNLED